MKILKTIRKFFVLLFLGILGLFGHDVTPRLTVHFANRNLIRQQKNLITSGSGKFAKGDEVDFIIKNGRHKQITKPAIVVQDAGGLMVKVVVAGDMTTRFIERKRLKKVSILSKVPLKKEAA